MTLNFNDKICQLLYRRFKDCLPLGLYKIWFRVKDSCLEGLGDLLGYSDKDFQELVCYSSLSRTNGRLYLDSWQKKLHITVEVREVSISGEQFKTVRFGDSISVGNSPQAFGASNSYSNDSGWRNKTYKDRDFMEIYISEYRNKYHIAYHVRNCTRLPTDILRLLERRKYQRKYESNEEEVETLAETRNYLAIDRNSSVDVAPHLTFFNNNFSDFEKEEIFIEELRKRKEFHMAVASPNNKLNHWYHFPTAYTKTDPEAEGNLSVGPKQLRYYKRKISKEMLEQFCESIGGTVQRGHHIVLEQLMEINAEWTNDILRSNGVNAFTKLTPEETLSLQTEANLSTSQRLLVARILRYFNGGVPVFAGEKEISKINWQECKSEMIFKTLVYYVDKDGKQYLEFDEAEATNRIKKQLKYFYCDVLEVLKDRLNYFRDILHFKNFVSIGMVLDNDQSKKLPLYIFITILGDHGGSEMKVVQLNSLRNGDGQKYSTCIGQFEAKESNFLFENTIFPPINTEIEELNNLMLLVVEWGSKNPGPGEDNFAFDYLFYPRQLFLDTDDYYDLPSLISWSNNNNIGIDGIDIGSGDIINFNFSDIPFNCRVRNINIVCFSSGDTAYQMRLIKRERFTSCRCMKCNLKLNEWQDQTVDGILYSNEDLNRIQSDLEITVEELSDLMMDEVELQQLEELHQNILGEAQEAAHRGGVEAGQSLILPAIELRNKFAIMVLHIKLGLVLALYNQFFLFIFDKLEVESDSVRHLRLRIVDAKEDYQTKCQLVTQYENDPTLAMEKIRVIIARNFKVKTDYEERPIGGRVPTNNQTEKYQQACHKLEELEPQWNGYGYDINNSDHLVEAKVRFDLFMNAREVMKAAEKDSKKVLSDTVKALQQARKNQYKKPVKEATEEVMIKFGIVTQAYHSHSLIGEHCHRFLMHRDEILTAIREVWINGVETYGQDYVEDDIYEKIDKFISEMSDLMEALDYCCSVLGRLNYWYNDEEIREFQSVATYFGIIWREYLKKSVPPKLHMLEKHAHEFLSDWRNTGNFGEDPVERDHHDENKFNRLFCNINNWEDRKKLIRDRKNLISNSKIANVSTTVLEGSSRKRVSNSSDNNDNEKRQKQAAAKVDLIKKVVIKTPNNSSQASLDLLEGGENGDGADSTA